MLLALLVTQLLTGAHSLRTKLIFAKEGEMVALNCPQYKEGHSQVVWTGHTGHTGQLRNLADTVSAPAGQSHREVLITGGSLIILRASVIHQGNYTCSLGNASRKTWFQLTVATTQFKENEGRGEYPATCYSQESCTLYCPEVNVPRVNSSILSSTGVTWHKKGQKSPAESRFMNVEEKDSGVYLCVRSYLHSGKIYNTTYTVILDVKPKIQTGQSVISSPKQNDVFCVDLGSTVVIGCKAVLYSSFDDVFWQSGASPIGTDNRLPVYYNYSRIKQDDKTEMTASLVFKKVSKEDLAKNYTCKLESDHQLPTFITITLTQRDRKSCGGCLGRFRHNLFLRHSYFTAETGQANRRRGLAEVLFSLSSGWRPDQPKKILKVLVATRLVFIKPDSESSTENGNNIKPRPTPQ